MAAGRCQEIPSWYWSNPISFLKGVFLCFLIVSSFYLLALCRLILFCIYILTLPLFHSTTSCIHILSCGCCIICNLCCKMYIYKLWWCWVFLTFFPLCSFLVLTLLVRKAVNPWNSSSLLSVSLVMLENLQLGAFCFGLVCLSFLKLKPFWLF